MIATFGEATVITRANNRDPIEAALSCTAEKDRLTFVYVDLPRWARWWKRGQHGVHLYYLLWQIAALRKGRRLHRAQPFDVVWHVTMTNAWMGALAPLIDAPFVYGPIGGGVRTPRRLIPTLGARGTTRETVYALLQFTSRHLNPFVHLAARRAQLILVQNPETRDWLAPAQRDKAVVFPNAVVARPNLFATRDTQSRVALFAGQLVPGKGVALAVRALVDLPGWQLVICGAGPEEHRLRRLVDALQLGPRVDFRGWVPREELWRIMAAQADVFVFPSLHDQSPWVLHEARAIGLPVVCLEGCGSTMLATVTVRTSWPRATARALAQGVIAARADPLPLPQAFDIETRRRRLATVLADAGLPIGRQPVSD
jgi:glycosyltransferase involved in cell wall biosynthesis